MRLTVKIIQNKRKLTLALIPNTINDVFILPHYMRLLNGLYAMGQRLHSDKSNGDSVLYMR